MFSAPGPDIQRKSQPILNFPAQKVVPISLEPDYEDTMLVIPKSLFNGPQHIKIKGEKSEDSGLCSAEVKTQFMLSTDKAK